MKYPVKTLTFRRPALNLEGTFNTLRLGRKWASLLSPGDTVMLFVADCDEVIGPAKVKRVEVGRLGEMLPEHARYNHNQLRNPDVEGAPGRALDSLMKRYGPNRVSETSWVSAIYLERVGKK